jgi:His-Xaa-Ser system radical SAM maturase HxsB
MRLLPFNFDRLEGGDYFLSNAAGFHTFLSSGSFTELVDFSKTASPDENARLESGLFIAQDENLETAVTATGSALAKKLMQELQFCPIFMIVPTLRCDHHCTYCQVSRAALSARNYDLDPAAIPGIIETIKKLSDAPYKLEIQGGEPLVRFDLVQQIYDEAAERLGPDNFELVIATSLSLLDDAVIDWAQDRTVIFSTSLDGSAVIHNQNRILPNGDSFEHVRDAVIRLQDQLGKKRVATVTTVTDALIKHPEALIEAHIELGLTDMFVRPISPYGFAGTQATASDTMSDYMAFYERLFDEVMHCNRAGTPLTEHSAAIHMKRALNPGFNQYADLKSPGGLLLNCVLFNYDGKIYGSDEARMLQRVLGDIDFSCGSIEAVRLNETDLYRSIIASSFNLVQPGCETCAYQPYCGSDPCQNISLQGEPVGDKSRSTFCQYHKGMFRFLLERYHTDSEAQTVLTRWCRD